MSDRRPRSRCLPSSTRTAAVPAVPAPRASKLATHPAGRPVCRCPRDQRARLHRDRALPGQGQAPGRRGHHQERAHQRRGADVPHRRLGQPRRSDQGTDQQAARRSRHRHERRRPALGHDAARPHLQEARRGHGREPASRLAGHRPAVEGQGGQVARRLAAKAQRGVLIRWRCPWPSRRSSKRRVSRSTTTSRSALPASSRWSTPSAPCPSAAPQPSPTRTQASSSTRVRTR